MQLLALSRPACRFVVVVLSALALSMLPPGNEPGQARGAARREEPARCVSETASLVRREAPGKPWKVVDKGDPLPAEQLLLLVGADAALDSANRAVRVTGLGEMTGISGFPVLETAVLLHDSRDVDLDFTLARGRVVLSNRKEAGAARVRVHIRDRAAALVLNEPGAAVALEVFGRWSKGVPFSKDPKPGVEPALAVSVLVLKGEVEIKGKEREFTLKAPPGPALLMGDSLENTDPRPQRVEKLPDWASGKAGPVAERKRRAAARLRHLALKHSIGEALDEFLNSDDEYQRRLAVYAMAAMDDLKRLAEAMTHARHPDVWDAGVVAMRNWIGRGPGQDQKLYRALIDQLKFSPTHAETVLSLLHSFGDEDLARPETYEMLIDYLGSDRLAVRGLAYWHLYRLVPAGRKFGYDPLGPPKQRADAIRGWRKLIPAGQMPPKS